jgi:hypothetical protein
MIRRAIRQHQAESFGREWVDLVTSGDLQRAFHFTVDSTRPAPPAEPNAPLKPSPYEAFVAQPVIKALEAAGKNPVIRIRDTLEFQANSYRSIVVRQLYEVSPAVESSGASKKPVEVVLSVQRAMLPRESMSRWLVTNYAFPKTDANPTVGP